ncbi:hypothetical protein AB5I41_01730 [Sphingomonas sp. MMS24-JH45]
MLYYTAQRIGDVVRMRWDDFADGRVRIVTGKTKRLVDMPQHEELAAELERAPRLGQTVLVKDGKPMKGSLSPLHPPEVYSIAGMSYLTDCVSTWSTRCWRRAVRSPKQRRYRSSRSRWSSITPPSAIKPSGECGCRALAERNPNGQTCGKLRQETAEMLALC